MLEESFLQGELRETKRVAMDDLGDEEREEGGGNMKCERVVGGIVGESPQNVSEFRGFGNGEMAGKEEGEEATTDCEARTLPTALYPFYPFPLGHKPPRTFLKLGPVLSCLGPSSPIILG